MIFVCWAVSILTARVFSVGHLCVTVTCVRYMLRLMFFCCVILNALCSVLLWLDRCRLQDVMYIVCIAWHVALVLIFAVLFGDAPNKTCFYNLLFSVQQPGTYIDNWCHADVKTNRFKKSLSSLHPLIASPRFTYASLLCLEKNKLRYHTKHSLYSKFYNKS